MSNSASSGNIRAARNAAKEILQKVDKAVRSPAGPKRWFWELLQNAIDSTSKEPDRKVDVTLKFEQVNDGKNAVMIFSHNGGPFLETRDPLLYADDFENLISPISGKSAEDNNTIGKFGTGFLSTHNLSLVIDVEGVLLTNDGKRIKLNASLDRTHYLNKSDAYAKERINGVIEGLENYDKQKSDAIPPDTEVDYTSFKYYLNDPESIKRVQTGFKEIEQSLPSVFALTDRISSIRIQDNISNEDYLYKKEPLKSYKKLSIVNSIKQTIDGKQIDQFSVAFLTQDSVTLLWPIEYYRSDTVILKDARKLYKSSLGSSMPLLFCTFPLIGSHEIQFPIIIHSEEFVPNETRDGVSLTKTTITDKKTDEEIDLDKSNRALLVKASKLYETFIDELAHDGNNIFYALKLNKETSSNWIDKKWYKDEVIEPLRSFALRTPLVDIYDASSERKSILNEKEEIQIFFPSISHKISGKISNRLNQKFFIFSAHLFGGNIPQWNDLKEWHRVLWQDQENIKTLHLEDILAEVQRFGSVKSLSIKLGISSVETFKWLNHLYLFIDQTDKSLLYQEYAVIPNQKGDFKKVGEELYSEESTSKIEPELICILRRLDNSSDWFDKLVHRAAKPQCYIEKRSLKEHISPAINTLLKDKEESGYHTFVNNKDAISIAQFLLSFKHYKELEDTNKVQIFNFSKAVFGNKKERIVPFYNDFDLSNIQKHTFRLINSTIEKSKNIKGLTKVLNKDESATIIWLNDYLNFQIKTTEYVGLIHSANVIPNQNGEFKPHGEEGDKDRIYKPYQIIKDGDKISISEILDKNIITVLKDLSNEKDDWTKLLVHDGIQLVTLPSKTWHDLGADIDSYVEVIAGSIINDNEEKKAVYLSPMLTLLDWCETSVGRPVAQEYFKTTYSKKDMLYMQLTYSPDIVKILKDQPTLDIAKKIQNSGISINQVDATIDALVSMAEKFGEESINEFLRNAEKFITHKEKFKNRLQTGQNIENLLKEALFESGIDVVSKKSNEGAFDLVVYNIKTPLNKLKLEVKSYQYGSSYDFRFAPSQVIEANRDNDNYVVCTLERKPEDEICDTPYLKNNLKVQNGFGDIVAPFAKLVADFDSIYKDSKSNKNPLIIPCIDEPRVEVSKTDILNNAGDFNSLIELIKAKLL
ncbi:hypothetical protein SAMN06298216_3525 [Spirosomataceae bacterium TFI 002]|nr:hypothetical protein SAMN06298216_3525 [Spirosomataceae bacterium TFI 002]